MDALTVPWPIIGNGRRMIGSKMTINVFQYGRMRNRNTSGNPIAMALAPNGSSRQFNLIQTFNFIFLAPSLTHSQYNVTIMK